jgi:outer membrane lipoprotein-sorting protein
METALGITDRQRIAELEMAGRSLGIFLGTLIWMSVSAPGLRAQTAPLPAPAPPKSAVKPPAPAASPAQAPRSSGQTDISRATPVLPKGKSIGRFAGPGETLALDANQRSLVDRVSLYLSTVQTLIGDFVQVASDGGRNEGQFYIQKPGKVRFDYEPPSPIDVISDGQSVVVRNRRLATQDVIPLSQTPLRFLLSDRIDLLRDTNVVGVYADDIFVTVVIEEKQPLIGTNRLMLMFNAKDLQLRQWTVTDPQGFDTTVAVYNLDTNKRPDPGMFKIDYTQYRN